MLKEIKESTLWSVFREHLCIVDSDIIIFISLEERLCSFSFGNKTRISLSSPSWQIKWSSHWCILCCLKTVLLCTSTFLLYWVLESSNSLGDLRSVISCVLALGHGQIHQRKWAPGNYRMGSEVYCFCICLLPAVIILLAVIVIELQLVCQIQTISWSVFNSFFKTWFYFSCL